MVFKVLQEPQHVRCVVRRDQGTRDWSVSNWIAGEQQNSVPKMDLVDAECAGELAQDLGSKLRTVVLPNRVFQTVVHKASRQFEQEFSLHRFLNCSCIEFVDQDAINDSLPFSKVKKVIIRS